MDNAAVQNLIGILIDFGFKILAALAIWVIGRKLITFVVRAISRTVAKNNVDETLLAYVRSSLTILLNLVLIIAILGVLGIETTAFVAFIGAAGLAIGAAWSGLLANFAAGVFLIVLRPFKVGEFVAAGGVTGTVKEIGLFVTSINTPDNILTFVGNNKIFSDTIQNFSANDYRRVDLVAQLNHSVEPQGAIDMLKQKLASIENVLADPAPDVEVLEFNLAGPVLAVRPYCNNAHYWQVYFDTNRLIRDAFGEAGYPAPEQHYAIQTKS